MNILFVYSLNDIFSPKKPLRTEGQMQFGISYVSSVLKAGGHKTRLVVLSRLLGRKNTRIVDDYIKEFNPGLICFSAVSTEFSFISNIAKYIKGRYPEIYLLIGGPHVSLNPVTASGEVFDALCIGEGEYPALELALQLEKKSVPSGIPNLWIKRGQDIEKNPTRKLVGDLNGLPFPDRQMWQGWIGEGQEEVSPVLLGRGCPFLCTYCSNHALRELAEGKYVRFRSPDNIINELESVLKCFPQRKNFYLEVETIGADIEWAIGLSLRLKELNSSRKEPLSFGVNLRIMPGLDCERIFSAFKDCNITVVNIGVESGSERIRREVLNRHYSNQEIIQAVRLARGFGLKIHFYNLIGIPGESINDFKETVRINRICQPDKVYTHIFFPYPGTKLYFKSREQGLLKKEPETALERCKAVLDLPEFRRNQVQKGFILFDYYVYRGYKPLLQIIAKVLVSGCRSNVYLHSFYRRLTYSFMFSYLRKVLKSYIKC